MADHYVDSAAAGGGDGSFATPWNSLASVNAHAKDPGDNFWLKKDSLFREALSVNYSGTSGAWITFGAYGSGALPQIRGCDVKTGWEHDGGDPANVWHIHGISGSYPGDPWDTPQIVLFDGVVGNRQTSKAAVDSQYDWYWDKAAGVVYVYSASDPDTLYTSPGVELGASRGCISASATGISYINIKDIEVFANDGGSGCYAERCAHWKFDNFNISHGARTGIYWRESTFLEVVNCDLQGYRDAWAGWRGVYAPSFSSGYPGGDVLIHHSTINNWSSYSCDIHGYSYSVPAYNINVHACDLSHSTTGVYVGHVDTVYLGYLICDDNLARTAGGEEYGIATSECQNTEVDHCQCINGRVGMEVWSIEDPAWPLHGPTHNLNIHHSKFSGNSEHGLMNYEGNTHTWLIRRCQMSGNGLAGLMLAEADEGYTSVVVRHNTLVGNDTANAGYADLYFGGPGANVTVKNNIFSNTNRFCLHTHSTVSFTHAHNAYYRASGTVIDINGTAYDLAHVTDFEATAKNEDPVFVSTATGDFHIKVTSPCKDTAEDLGDTDDYDGNPAPVGGGYDIGAFEALDLLPAEGYQSQGSDSPAMGVLPPTGPDAVIGTIPIAPFTIPYRTKDPQLNATLERIRHKLNELTELINENTADIAAIQAVVGEAVVDARIDDTINSGDATTDGVIDALRDAMIAHGLISSS